MLIGSSMEDILRTMDLENLLHLRRIGNRTHNGPALDFWIGMFHEEAHLMHWCFGLIDQYKFSGLERSDLMHHFRTDGTSCTGNQDSLVVE